MSRPDVIALLREFGIEPIGGRDCRVGRQKPVQNQSAYAKRRAGRRGVSPPASTLTSPTCKEVAMAEMTQARARELFNYDPETGVLTWRQRPMSDFSDDAHGRTWNTRFAGLPAKYQRSDGYRLVTVDYRRYLQHRLVWVYVYGNLPCGEIDHINGDPSDNRIANLRDVGKQQNARNAQTNTKNTSGVTGVRFCTEREKWHAFIARDGLAINLGRFNTKAEAMIARKAAEKALGFHPNHGRRRRVS